jgi:hypothetical protein
MREQTTVKPNYATGVPIVIEITRTPELAPNQSVRALKEGLRDCDYYT